MKDAGTSAKRIRIGLTGLGVAFLLVLLGSAISRSGGGDRADNAANLAEPSEPLAELGVTPGAAETDSNKSSNTQ